MAEVCQSDGSVPDLDLVTMLTMLLVAMSDLTLHPTKANTEYFDQG